ncbi:SRPBCC family protein, partial [Streptomyces sp. NPDC006393]|uniref:type II toxin-antitoxin system RatA family toxin n=1 Tax=Streptomyces sp. NPDC006393 TaxID=3156763 RepID=UPI0033E913F2
TPPEVWQLVKDAATFVHNAPHVVAVEALTTGGAAPAARTTRWTVLLNGSRTTWTQQEHAEPGPLLRFEQTDGDLEELSGHWTLHPTPAGTTVSLRLGFELGVDGLTPLLEPMWTQSLQAHADALLRALSATAAHARTGSDPCATT